MTLDEAIAALKEQYSIASSLEYVQNPVAYALYQTWKIADRKPRKKATYAKCMDCKWWVDISGHVLGGQCFNPNKKFRTNTSHWKYRTTKACKMLERKEE